jgi:hypothetical protein
MTANPSSDDVDARPAVRSALRLVFWAFLGTLPAPETGPLSWRPLLSVSSVALVVLYLAINVALSLSMFRSKRSDGSRASPPSGRGSIPEAVVFLRPVAGASGLSHAKARAP